LFDKNDGARQHADKVYNWLVSYFVLTLHSIPGRSFVGRY